MPIKKELYPDNWPEISRRIREERAKNKCERCGVDNHAIGARDVMGDWHDIAELDQALAGVVNSFDDWPPRTIQIILTVAHLDQNPSNNDESNLACLCQRCHLNHDRPFNLLKRHATWARKHEEQIAATGQLPLEGVL